MGVLDKPLSVAQVGQVFSKTRLYGVALAASLYHTYLLTISVYTLPLCE